MNSLLSNLLKRNDIRIDNITISFNNETSKINNLERKITKLQRTINKRKKYTRKTPIPTQEELDRELDDYISQRKTPIPTQEELDKKRNTRRLKLQEKLDKELDSTQTQDYFDRDDYDNKIPIPTKEELDDYWYSKKPCIITHNGNKKSIERYKNDNEFFFYDEHCDYVIDINTKKILYKVIDSKGPKNNRIKGTIVFLTLEDVDHIKKLYGYINISFNL